MSSITGVIAVDGTHGAGGAGHVTGPDGARAVGAMLTAAAPLIDADLRRWTNHELLEVLTGLEETARTLTGIGVQILARMQAQGAGAELLGARLADLLTDRLRLSGAEARTRIGMAEDLAPQELPSGGTAPPALPATRAALGAGQIGTEHVRHIRWFAGQVPAEVDAATVAAAETQLVDLARQARPEHVRTAAERILTYLTEGDDRAERARRRRQFVHMNRPDRDGMSTGRFCVDPELRALLEALFAAYAKPGRCDPDDPRGEDGDAPVTVRPPAPRRDPGASADGAGDEQNAAADHAADTDTGDPGPVSRPVREVDLRTPGQRRHDALKVGLRATLSSGLLGEHRGLPVTVVITARLTDLIAVCGHGTTAGGTLMPVRDVLRLAAHAHQTLALFDDLDRPLQLGRSRRIASPDQRLMLYAGDRGCTFPGCTAPAYHAQVHHLQEWADGGPTDIANLTLACEPHHRLIGAGTHQWATTRAGPDDPDPGRTLWHPPSSVDPQRRGRVNRYHHPHEYLRAPEHLRRSRQPTLAEQQRRGTVLQV